MASTVRDALPGLFGSFTIVFCYVIAVPMARFTFGVTLSAWAAHFAAWRRDVAAQKQGGPDLESGDKDDQSSGGSTPNGSPSGSPRSAGSPRSPTGRSRVAGLPLPSMAFTKSLSGISEGREVSPTASMMSPTASMTSPISDKSGNQKKRLKRSASASSAASGSTGRKSVRKSTSTLAEGKKDDRYDPSAFQEATKRAWAAETQMSYTPLQVRDLSYKSQDVSELFPPLATMMAGTFKPPSLSSTTVLPGSTKGQAFVPFR